MISIDTTIEPITVEIDGRRFDVAPRTIEVCERIVEAERANMGRPYYRFYLDAIRILLGKRQFRELFHKDDRENVTRIDAIYKAVSRAFTGGDEEPDSEEVARQMAEMKARTAELNALIENARALYSHPPEKVTVQRDDTNTAVAEDSRTYRMIGRQ